MAGRTGAAPRGLRVYLFALLAATQVTTSQAGYAATHPPPENCLETPKQIEVWKRFTSWVDVHDVEESEVERRRGRLLAHLNCGEARKVGHGHSETTKRPAAQPLVRGEPSPHTPGPAAASTPQAIPLTVETLYNLGGAGATAAPEQDANAGGAPATGAPQAGTPDLGEPEDVDAGLSDGERAQRQKQREQLRSIAKQGWKFEYLGYSDIMLRASCLSSVYRAPEKHFCNPANTSTSGVYEDKPMQAAWYWVPDNSNGWAHAMPVDWDPEWELSEAGSQAVVILVKAPPFLDLVSEKKGDPVVHCRATGYSTLQACTVTPLPGAGSAGGRRLKVAFAPRESGPHNVTLRLEYASDKDVLAEQSKRPAQYLGRYFPGSPYTVEVPPPAEAPGPGFGPLRDPATLPLCTTADQGGLWRNVVGPGGPLAPPDSHHIGPDPPTEWKMIDNSFEGLFAPDGHVKVGGCPTKDRKRYTYPGTKNQQYAMMRGEGKERLLDGDKDGDPWHSWDLWTGRDCRYCRKTREEARACLASKRVTVVSDSVGMQTCSYLQCAHNGTAGCHISCGHRTNPSARDKFDKLPCYEKQPGAGPFYCVSFDNFFGEPLTGGDRGARLVTKYSDAEVAGYVEGARYRASGFVPDPVDEDILVLSSGLHDNAFFSIKFPPGPRTNVLERVWRHVLTIGYDRVIYVLPTAIHRHVAFSANCSAMNQILSPSCMQYVQLHMTNARTLEIHAATRAALNATQEKLRAEGQLSSTRVDFVDAFPVSELREDHTKTHGDMVHYCYEYDREMTQILLHTICRCGEES